MVEGIIAAVIGVLAGVGGTVVYDRQRRTGGKHKADQLVADAKTSKLLGVHIVSENAGDVIYAATLAVKFGLTVEDLKDSLAPYLTMAEGLKLAALTFDKDVSKLSCCAG